MNLLKTYKKQLTVFSAYLCSLIIFVFLAILFPLSGDDWTWAGMCGDNYISAELYKGMNGRYFGNLLVILLTRVNFIRCIVVALTLFFTCFFIFKLSSKQTCLYYILLFLLFFLMPQSIFVQAVVWCAGFCNYATSALFSLIIIVMFKNVLDDSEPKYSKITPYLAFFITIIGSLFMENMTIFNVMLALLIIIYTKIKHKKVYSAQIWLLIGSICGSIIMFTNGAYISILTGKDSYRGISLSSSFFSTILDNLYQMSQILFGDNCITLAIISLLLLGINIINFKKTNLYIVGLLSSIASLFLSLFMIFLRYFIWFGGYFMAAMVVLWIITTLITLFFSIPKTKWLKMFYPLILIVLMFLPLIIVSPIGPRNFYSMHLLLILFTLNLTSHFLSNFEEKVILKKVLYPIFITLTLLITAFYFYIYIPIHKYDTARNNFSKQQIADNQTTIVSCKLPNADWVHHETNPSWEDRYRDFLDIGYTKNFEFISYTEFFEYIDSYNKTHHSK